MPTERERERDRQRMVRYRQRTGGAYDQARRRALIRLSKLYPTDYRRLLDEELVIAQRAAEAGR